MTLLVEPPIFIPRLEHDLRRRQVQFVRRSFLSSAEILSTISENIIINCTGLGPMTLWNDSLWIRSRANWCSCRRSRNCSISTARTATCSPDDWVVVGGTYQHGVNNETPVKSDCEHIIAVMKGNFGVRTGRAARGIPHSPPEQQGAHPECRRRLTAAPVALHDPHRPQPHSRAPGPKPRVHRTTPGLRPHRDAGTRIRQVEAAAAVHRAEGAKGGVPTAHGGMSAREAVARIAGELPAFQARSRWRRLVGWWCATRLRGSRVGRVGRT